MLDQSAAPPEITLNFRRDLMAHVFRAIRAGAWRLLDAVQPDVSHMQREYLTGLLLGTLNILRPRHYKEMSHLQPRRELALLSAAMICQHLL